MAKVKKEDSSVEFNKVREMVRKELESKYGGVSKFLHSEKGKEFGGFKIKIYLYDSGPINFDVISRLCTFLGIGELSRKIIVKRNVFYSLKK